MLDGRDVDESPPAWSRRPGQCAVVARGGVDLVEVAREDAALCPAPHAGRTRRGIDSPLLPWEGLAMGRGFDQRQGAGGQRGPGGASSPGLDPGKRTLTEQLPVQRSANGAGGTDSGAVREAATQGVAGGGGPLPHVDMIQRLFGRHDISGVKAHVGGLPELASRAIGAEAYAIGHHVAFASPPSFHTVAHEAAHVVQQRGGVQLKGGVGESGDAHEQHANAVADAVMQGKSAEALLDRYASSSGAGSPAVQRRLTTHRRHSSRRARTSIA
jgi:hypothetical protein